MFIDCSKLPDPANPQPDDVFTSASGDHTVVVTMSSYRSDDDEYSMRLVRDGTVICIPTSAFIPLLASLGLRPWGRLDRSAATCPTIISDPEQVQQRLVAFGPHLRALREQHGLSMGDLARAVGCPPARLSMLELAQPDPVREGAGVREDEGRAALAELLTETAVRAAYAPVPPASSLGDRGRLWSAIHEMLDTGPALAAMSTIMRARAEDPSSAQAKATPTPPQIEDPAAFAARVVVDLEDSGALIPAGRGGVSIATGRGGFVEILTGALTRLARRPSMSSERSDAMFKPGDRIVYKGKAAVVADIDGEAFELLLVTFESGETSAVPATDVELVNENVAIASARAGLAHLLATDEV